jgi:hypothetical protein
MFFKLEYGSNMFLRNVSSYNSNLLCDVMVSVLAIRPKVRGFKPSRGDGFLRAIKFVPLVPSDGKKNRRSNVVRFYGM